MHKVLVKYEFIIKNNYMISLHIVYKIFWKSTYDNIWRVTQLPNYL